MSGPQCTVATPEDLEQHIQDLLVLEKEPEEDFCKIDDCDKRWMRTFEGEQK